MKISIYDLLGMIKDDNIPQRIIFKGQTFEYDKYSEDYFNEECGYLFDEYVLTSILNDELEILETTITYNQDTMENNKQDKIEKLGKSYMKEIGIGEYISEPFKTSERVIINKINEIIDRINKE